MTTTEIALKCAQMSDLHYCAGNLIESDRCFTAAVSQAIANNVDCALITGDSTDHAMDAHSPAIVALAKQIQRLANHCPVLMLQGTFSHEPPGLLKMLSLIGAKYPITVADRIGSFGLLQDRFELVEPSTEYRLVVSAVPTLNKADIAALSSDSVGSAAIEAGRIIAEVLASLAPMNRCLRSKGIPTMVISHGTVLNCMTEHGVPMAGADHEFGAGALFSANADAVALGHIHKHQLWRTELNGSQQVIAYAGSIGRFHHGEVDDKVWLEWCLQAGNPQFTAHPTPARRTIDLFFDGPPDLEKIRAAAEQCKGAFVRVRYEVDQEHRQGVDRAAIKAILGSALDVQIEGKTLVIERIRAKGISTAPSLAEKLSKWCEATATPREGLTDRLSALQNSDATSVVKDIVDGLQGKTVVSNKPTDREPEPLKATAFERSPVVEVEEFSLF